jgi:hypothetical protein
MTSYIQITSRRELVCPICHVVGECAAHCVEVWQEGHRKDHLRAILVAYPNIAEGLLRTLFEQCATPEDAFEDCRVVVWNDEVPATFLPLFTGTAMVHTQEPLRWFALFHREGPTLLARYEQRVKGQLMRGFKMREMIQTLRQEEVQPVQPRDPGAAARPKPIQPTLDESHDLLHPNTGAAAPSTEYEESDDWATQLILSLL